MTEVNEFGQLCGLSSGVFGFVVSQDSFICESASFGSDDKALKRCVPTQTQIRQQLGSKLSDVFFEYVGNEGKAYLGLEPPLVGPDTVWIDPDARLENKVCLTPVTEPDVLRLKAFTHESVLEVGQTYIELLENQHRLELEEALRKQAEEVEEECLRRFAPIDDFENGDESGQCKKVVATLMEHFDSCFNDLVKTTQIRMRKECQLKVEEERAELASYMLIKLQEEVQRRDDDLCKEFHDILRSELNILSSKYIEQINQEREIAAQLMRETVRNYEKMLSDLKIEMELNNVVDVCRAITQERVNCSERVRQIEKGLRSKQNDCAKYIKELKAQNSTLQKMSTERLKRLMQWRMKVRVLLEEFQRFINFALKAVPGQSEFLLNMEKLMLKNFPEDSFLMPEDYLYFKNCIKGRLTSDEAVKTPETPEIQKSPEIEKCEEKTDSGEETPGYCNDSKDEDKETPGLTFDYNKFKSILVRRFALELKSPAQKMKKRTKKTICLWRKKSKDIILDKSNELCQMLTLAGENEKEHLAPLNCFLYKRLKAVQKICQDDPEFAKIILGCPNK